MHYRSFRSRHKKVHKCPHCENKMTREEISRTWDHAGPHCMYCGNTGMNMLAAVIENDYPEGIQTGVAVVISKMKSLYYSITGKKLKVYASD